MTAKKATKKATKKKTAKKKAIKSAVRGTAWTFPKNTLEEAIKIPRAIEEKNAGNAWPASELARAVGYKQPNDWRFQDLLRSANQYGIAMGTGATAVVELTALGEDIVAPSSPTERAKALLEAFSTVDDFRSVSEFYQNKKLPEDEFFLNTLNRQFGIPRERVETFSEIFQKNLRYLRAFEKGVPKDKQDTEEVSSLSTSPTSSSIAQTRSDNSVRAREFLDSCFVMMPFGQWPDLYYKSIYCPAINEAGFEPIRGDELFTTGSVVEQIWEQIEKSTVLLADLTDKNANVFYELGLAHAARKPVVLTAGHIEDVPFDLRHLRVITYDIRMPDWASSLRENVTEYLRNAAKDPMKSIPNPFRLLYNSEENSA